MTSGTPPSGSKYPIVINRLPDEPDFEAPLGYEPEGSSICGDSFSEDDSSKPSSGTKWYNDLQSLLNSKNGLKHLQKYLEKSNVNHFHMVRFFFACKGLSMDPQAKEVQLRVIFNKFIRENLFEIEKHQRDAVVAYFEENRRGEPIRADIFNDICHNIWEKMNTEMYPNFLAYQKEKMENRNKPSSRSNHDCKKYFFEQCRSSHCQRKPTDRVIDSAMPPEPAVFYKDLMQKLEKVKNEEEEDRTKEYRSQPNEVTPLRDVLARVISEKVEEFNYEDILDQHIDRVLPDEINASSNYDIHKYSDSKKNMLAKNMVPHPYMGTGPVRKKGKDVYSMFSSDSGFGTGYYSDDTRGSDYVPSECHQQRKSTWASRQTLADSGTGMMSEDEYAQYNEKMYEKRDKYRMSHPGEANKYRMGHSSEADKYRMTHINEGDARYRPNFNTMSNKGRHNFINDIPSVSMNSLHSFDSYAQVEEERRRKLRNEMRLKLKSPSWTDNSYQSQGNASAYSKHSSCKMENIQHRVEDFGHTTVVYNFSDEKLPYRVKVPGNRITLKQFKEFMPKKGNYRYFFITPCEDLGAVQEEITDEGRVLPLWEGKVDARIKTVK